MDVSGSNPSFWANLKYMFLPVDEEMAKWEEAYRKSQSQCVSEEELDHDYRPLPKYLRIYPSKIEGYGVHTLQDIENSTEIGISHVKAPVWLKGVFDNDLIRTPLGGFLNHCSEANCHLYQFTNGTLVLVAKRNIKMGEELTLNYNNELCGIKK